MTVPVMPAATTTATRCPGCGSDRTVWTQTAAQRNFLCKTCGTCWHPAPGSADSADGADRVDPRGCPGCSLRRICLAACC